MHAVQRPLCWLPSRVTWTVCDSYLHMKKTFMITRDTTRCFTWLEVRCAFHRRSCAKCRSICYDWKNLSAILFWSSSISRSILLISIEGRLMTGEGSSLVRM
eukprot:XP_001709332.1 Hypothetical protein GL50803_32094 [Giardia lamblia ATCC 50803]